MRAPKCVTEAESKLSEKAIELKGKVEVAERAYYNNANQQTLDAWKSSIDAYNEQCRIEFPEVCLGYLQPEEQFGFKHF